MAKSLVPKGFASFLKKIGQAIYTAQGRNEQGLLSPVPDESGLISPVVTTPSPTPTVTPNPEQVAQRMTMNYEPYISDRKKITQNYPQGLPQPSLEQKKRILLYSPQDATRSAILKMAEVGSFNDYLNDFTGNENKTIDRGPNMINSGTFNDMWNKQGMGGGTYPYREEMMKRGISSFEDMKNPTKNEAMMDLVRKRQGYGAWFGPRNKGFNIYK